MAVTAYTEIIATAEVRARRRAFEEQCFSEQEHASQLRIESLAARLCLKRALVRAYADSGYRDASEKDFWIMPGDEHHLRLAAIAAPQAPGSIRLSVSHTRDHAVGVAAIAVGANNG